MAPYPNQNYKKHKDSECTKSNDDDDDDDNNNNN